MTNELLILLGRERFVKSWSGSNRWASFAGKAEKREDPFQCAARELYEETLALHLLPSHSSNTSNWASVDEMESYLRSLPCSSLILFPAYGARKTKYLQVHACFLVGIHHDPGLPQEFHNLHQKLKRFESLSSKDSRKRYYESLSPEIQSHPAVIANSDGDIQVRDVFLEKKELQYWSLKRLRGAFHRWGRHRGRKNLFRKCFQRTLHIVIERLRKINEEKVKKPLIKYGNCSAALEAY